jgi:hypothetical protein
MVGMLVGPTPLHTERGKKKPLRCGTGGAKSFRNDQNPRGASVTTETAETATTDTWAKREAVVVARRFMKGSRERRGGSAVSSASVAEIGDVDGTKQEPGNQKEAMAEKQTPHGFLLSCFITIARGEYARSRRRFFSLSPHFRYFFSSPFGAGAFRAGFGSRFAASSSAVTVDCTPFAGTSIFASQSVALRTNFRKSSLAQF